MKEAVPDGEGCFIVRYVSTGPENGKRREVDCSLDLTGFALFENVLEAPYVDFPKLVVRPGLDQRRQMEDHVAGSKGILQGRLPCNIVPIAPRQNAYVVAQVPQIPG